MGYDNIAKLAKLLAKLHKVPTLWVCIPPRPPRSSRRRSSLIKLVRSDGSFEFYDRPVSVSELTKDFPKHKICRSDSLYIGQKTPVLSETDTLQAGFNYFLLPSDFFKNNLSFLTITALKSSQNGGVLVKKGLGGYRQPFFIHKGQTGRLRIRVSEEFLSELMMEGREKVKCEEGEGEGEGGRVCTTMELKKDYVQLVGLRKWKPKLETIMEFEKKRRRFPVMKRKCVLHNSSPKFNKTIISK